MRCSNCGREVPEGVFCTVCGAHQGTTGQLGDPATRLHYYAAHPGEHVLHPGMFTTLFPHLGQHGVHRFRWAFIIGVLAIFVLYLIGLITAALLVAIFLLPGIYLLYLVEAEVYRAEPARVIGFSLGGGLVVGAILTLLTNLMIRAISTPGARLELGVLATTTTLGYLLAADALVPFLQELLKPLPALALRSRFKYQETIDGLVFGVAAGLGFSAGELLVRYWNPLSNLPAHTDPANWILPLFSIGVLRMIMQGAATGAITAAVWRFGRGRAAERESGIIAAAVVAHIAFDLISQLLLDGGFGWFPVLVWQAIVDGALLIYLRFVLHHALLDEGTELGFHQTVCPNCHRHIMAAGFCPNCGRALTGMAPGSQAATEVADRPATAEG